jgi:hypothetical protein
VAFGLVPYNYFTCKAGVVLKQLGAGDSVIDTSTSVQLMALGCVGLFGPAAAKFVAKKLAGGRSCRCCARVLAAVGMADSTTGGDSGRGHGFSRSGSLHGRPLLAL